MRGFRSTFDYAERSARTSDHAGVYHIALTALLCLLTPAWGLAHVGPHPSIHDTVARVQQRLKETLPHDELVRLTADRVVGRLTAEDKRILGSEHVSFRVNVPVVVSVVRAAEFGKEPFWLETMGFQRTEMKVQLDDEPFDVWQREFPAGHIGLGVNSLRGGGKHYLVAVRPKAPGDVLTIADLYPGQLRLAGFHEGISAYADRPYTLQSVPPGLKGQRLVQTLYHRRNDGRILGTLRLTRFPSSPRPDHVLLTWSEDPRTTQTIQWRTHPSVKQGVVAWQRKRDRHRFQPKPPQHTAATYEVIATPDVVNDPVIHRFTAVLTGLEPDTTYVYSVGDGSEDRWTELAEFTTAPAGVKPFSFIYMGDAQNGLDRWGTLVRNASRRRPDVAFYMMAGDLVNRGHDRDDWDDLFENAKTVYHQRPLLPAIGNHECSGGRDPELYLKRFTLPRNGPRPIAPERAYAFEYSNACFLVLDSNLPPQTQTEWIDQQLAATKSTWKFVMYHHPAYPSKAARENTPLQEYWTPLFDKHHVDMALQGHDHAYLRTYPMKGNRRVATAKEGTIYIISVSGTKMYTQEKHEYTERGMTNTATYQVLDIQIQGNRLHYRAFDIDGKDRDELTIEK